METVASIAFVVLLAACAAALLASHVRSWKAAQRGDLEPAELEYRRRQYRRRMQTSALLAVLAGMLLLAYWFMIRGREAGPGALSTRLGVLLVVAALLLLVWVLVLALADVWATKFYFGRIRDRYRLEQTKLEAQLRQIRRSREQAAGPTGNGNGDPRSAGPQE